jgi:hypothetical protein
VIDRFARRHQVPVIPAFRLSAPAPAAPRRLPKMQRRAQRSSSAASRSSASLYGGYFRPKRRLGFSMPWRARCRQRALSTLLRSPNSSLRLPRRGGKESTEMKSSITSVVVAAILLAGTFAARAQFTEGDVSHPKARSTHHYSPHHRMRTKGQTERMPSSTEDASDLSYPRLPSVFRNCEEPIPWFCRDL